MSPLEIVGITTIIFVGSLAVIVIIIGIPSFKLFKKLKGFSARINKKVMPAVDKLEKASNSLNKEMENASKLKGKADKLIVEINNVKEKFNKIKGDSSFFSNTINLLKNKS